MSARATGSRPRGRRDSRVDLGVVDATTLRVEADRRRPTARRLFAGLLEMSYVDLADPTHLEFEYMRRVGDVIDLAWPADRALTAVHLGGAACTLARYLAATRPRSRSEVYEHDERVLALARSELGLRPSRSLRVRLGDARELLERRGGATADLVIGDAFSGTEVPAHLLTIECAREVRRVLRDDGVYVLNVIDAAPLSIARRQIATLLQVFGELVVTGAAEAPAWPGEWQCHPGRRRSRAADRAARRPCGARAAARAAARTRGAAGVRRAIAVSRRRRGRRPRRGARGTGSHALTAVGGAPGSASGATLVQSVAVPTRALVLSWEYPPVIEGGLARHVRKLSRGARPPGRARRGHSPAAARTPRRARNAAGVIVHRLREPSWPRDLDRFVAWVDQMNADMIVAGQELADEQSFDLVHGHDWLVASAAASLADRLRRPVPRDRACDRVRPSPGLGRQAAAVAHPRGGAADGAPRRAGDHLLALHARARRRHLRHRRGSRHGDSERHRSARPAPGRRPGEAAVGVRRLRRAARAARRAPRLREGLPARPAGAARRHPPRRRGALPRCRIGHARAGAQGPGAASSA